MPKLRLSYFDFHGGRAEPPRLARHIGAAGRDRRTRGVLALVSWETRAAAEPGVDVAEAYRAHGRFVAHVIQGLTGPGPPVEGLLQETFIVAHRKRQRYDGRAAVRTWL